MWYITGTTRVTRYGKPLKSVVGRKPRVASAWLSYIADPPCGRALAGQPRSGETKKPLRVRGLAPLVARCEPYRPVSGLALAPWRRSPGCRALRRARTLRAVRDYERKFRRRRTVADAIAELLPTSQLSESEAKSQAEKAERVRSRPKPGTKP